MACVGACLGSISCRDYAAPVLLNQDSQPASNSCGLTRKEVSARLGVSVSSIRRMEGLVLHPQLDSAGVWRFKPEEVAGIVNERAPRSPHPRGEDEGQLAARVFEAFEAGCDLSDIVIEQRIHPAVVRELYSQWSVSLEDGERERRHESELAAERREARALERLMRPSR